MLQPGASQTVPGKRHRRRDTAAQHHFSTAFGATARIRSSL